jgi:DNA repair exonuclease SbcCD nuclease subunit
MVSKDPVRVVVTADNHLNRFYDRMSPQKLSQRRGYLRAGFKAAVDHALAWPAHLFLIAGDLFDQPDPRNTERVFVAHCLAQLRAAGVQVFAVSGNHDTPRQRTEQGGYAPQEIYRELGALTLFESSTEITTALVEVGGMLVALGGLGLDPAAVPGSDPLAGLTWADRPADADVGILLLHGLVEGYAPPDRQAPVFSLHTLAALAGADVIIAGDIHRPAVRQVGTHTLIIPGATERMTFGEDPGVPGFVTLEIVAGGAVQHTRMPLAGQPRADLLIRTADLPAERLTEYLIEQVVAVCTPETLVRLRLEGLLPRARYHQLDMRRLSEAILPLAFQFTLDDAGLLVEDEFHLATARGVRLSQPEEIRQLAEELLTGASSADAAVITEALQRLLTHY